jgi:hypothetical protein
VIGANTITSFLRAIALSFALCPVPAAALAFDHSGWTSLLQEFVDEQHRVDYKTLKQKGVKRLEDYVAQLARAPLEALSAEERKSLLINSYNALTVRWIVEHYPIPSIWATPEPFTEARHNVGGESLSLDEIEKRLRGTEDARIHSALVCAARSCPPLRREAYDAGRLDEQLDDNTRQWLANPDLNRFRLEEGKIELSPIFKWYGEDFERGAGGLRGFVARYAPEQYRAALSGNGTLNTTYLSYDWALNDQSDAGDGYSWFDLAIDWVRNWFR